MEVKTFLFGQTRVGVVLWQVPFSETCFSFASHFAEKKLQLVISEFYMYFCETRLDCL